MGNGPGLYLAESAEFIVSKLFYANNRQDVDDRRILMIPFPGSMKKFAALAIVSFCSPYRFPQRKWGP